MNTRRDFLKSTVLGAGALSLTPCFAAFGAAAPAASIPKRFVFIRKSNGERPHEVALPTLSAKDKALEDKKQPLEVDLHNHELPPYLPRVGQAQGQPVHPARLVVHDERERPLLVLVDHGGL